ncbi:FAD-dependent monooxygenase [Tepidiphilus sp. J10]|uniref:FAD-dependent monooxygenase n=1 Tax=Tepidiphilus sp. J10 TaxID=2502185 RepID=UPI00115EF2AE|nr:FAD-dependent monooxygenase [Tepidiphilus sp. J10]
MPHSSSAPEVAIVGAGPVGLTLALWLHELGRDTLVFDARPLARLTDDARVLALSLGTWRQFERLQIAERLPATPIRTIHVSQRGFGRVRLEAHVLGVPFFGAVVRASDLITALLDAAQTRGIAVLDETPVESADAQGERIALRTPKGAFHARLCARAEGRLPAEAEGVVSHDYGQSALIGWVHAEGLAPETAVERFTSQGPAALLPDHGQWTFVHVMPHGEAERALAQPDADYLNRLEHTFGNRWRLSEIHGRAAYPLVLRWRRRPVAERTVWLGNAAQTLHPVAGQGFNLAARDLATLVELLREADDPGSAWTLERYARRRALDRRLTIGLTDGFVRGFLPQEGLLPLTRGAALLALDACLPLKARFARQMMFGWR